MRIVLLLTCLAVLARSGPVPACQLDELFEICFAGSCDDIPADVGPVAGPMARPAAEPAGPMVAVPFGNDTPDDIACDTAIQQSFGSAHQAAPALHDAGSPPFLCDLLPPIRSGGALQNFSTAPPARALYPPSPPTLKHRPLLI